jgi:hypothetical protein
MVLSIKDLYIHFILEELREEMDLEMVWTTPTDPRDVERFRLMSFSMYGK